MIIVFKLTRPALTRRVPGAALDALPTAPLLKRPVEPDPPDTEVIKRILDALRRAT